MFVSENVHKLAENNTKKSNCPKNWSKRVPHYMIAEVLNTSESTVKAIRTGQRSSETPTGERVQVAEIILSEGINHLLEETKRVVQFK